MKNKLIILSMVLLSTFVLISAECSCIKSTNPDDFKPKDYADFVVLAFDNYMNCLTDAEKENIISTEWLTFADMKTAFEKNNIDIEVEFINRFLKNDALWNKYGVDRKIYEKENPGKTYLDQIVEFIST